MQTNDVMNDNNDNREFDGTGLEPVDDSLKKEYTKEMLDKSNFVKLPGGVNFHCNHKNDKKSYCTFRKNKFWGPNY